MNRRHRRYRDVSILVAFWLLALACNRDDGGRNESPTTRTGTITIDGSATLEPVSRTLANAFQRANARVTVTVGESGTAAGFQKLCAGEIDIAGASRPINAAELQSCRSHRIEFFELPVAFDSLSVVVSPRNSFVSCLTVAELRTMWAPSAQAKTARWNQIRSTFPPETLDLVGPGTGSGTFDYFTMAINGMEHSSRSDYATTDDPAALADQVSANAHALGYLAFAHYLPNNDRLKLVAIDNGQGCVTPSAATVTDETYQPLSRPIFIYASARAIARADVKAFARYYLSPDHASTIRGIGYVPLPTATLLSIARHLDKNLTGTIFGGRGSVLGVTAALFEDDERVQNALVR